MKFTDAATSSLSPSFPHQQHNILVGSDGEFTHHNHIGTTTFPMSPAIGNTAEDGSDPLKESQVESSKEITAQSIRETITGSSLPQSTSAISPNPNYRSLLKCADYTENDIKHNFRVTNAQLHIPSFHNTQNNDSSNLNPTTEVKHYINSEMGIQIPQSGITTTHFQVQEQRRKKKPYKELTLEEKVELIRIAEQNTNLSQASIAERYKIAKSNVCRILQRKEEYLLAFESSGFLGSRKRKLKSSHEHARSTEPNVPKEILMKGLTSEEASVKQNEHGIIINTVMPNIIQENSKLLCFNGHSDVTSQLVSDNTSMQLIKEGSEPLQTHMFKNHQLSKTFICRCCNWVFPDKNSLHVHVKAVNCGRSITAGLDKNNSTKIQTRSLHSSIFTNKVDDKNQKILGASEITRKNSLSAFKITSSTAFQTINHPYEQLTICSSGQPSTILLESHLACKSSDQPENYNKVINNANSTNPVMPIQLPHSIPSVPLNLTNSLEAIESMKQGFAPIVRNNGNSLIFNDLLQNLINTKFIQQTLQQGRENHVKSPPDKQNKEKIRNFENGNLNDEHENGSTSNNGQSISNHFQSSSQDIINNNDIDGDVQTQFSNSPSAASRHSNTNSSTTSPETQNRAEHISEDPREGLLVTQANNIVEISRNAWQCKSCELFKAKLSLTQTRCAYLEIYNTAFQQDIIRLHSKSALTEQILSRKEFEALKWKEKSELLHYKLLECREKALTIIQNPERPLQALLISNFLTEILKITLV